jgi:hypothetical protein
MNEYYLFENDAQRGPFTLSQLQSMWRIGTITTQTLYCESGFEEWLPLSTMLDLLEPSSQLKFNPRTTALSQSRVKAVHHTTLNPGDIICPNSQCGYCGPPRKVPRGSLILGLILCLFFILPGVIYLMVMSGYNYICPRCGLHIRGGRHS